MPTVTMSAAKASAFLAAYQKRLQEKATEAIKLDIEQGRAELILASSGTHSSEDLYNAGHPYARRAPQVAYDPSIINAQTGEFRDAWFAEAPEVTEEPTGTVVTARCVNRDPKAHFMFGTPLMVKRPVVKRATAAILENRKLRLKQAVKSAISAARADVRS